MSIGKRREFDYYPTPVEVIEALLDREEFFGEVWEPASGDDRIVDALKRRGIDAVGTDIQSGDDFFKTRRTPECIITNPPYSHATEFVARSFRLAKHKVAMLLPLEFLTGVGRYQKIWTSTEFGLKSMYVFPRRIQFIKGASPPNSHVWFVWEKGHVGPPKLEHVELGSSTDSHFLTFRKPEEVRTSDHDYLTDLQSQLTIIKDRIRGIVHRQSNGLYLCGRAGTSKTHTVRTTLEELQVPYKYSTGHLTPIGLFNLLANHREMIIVLDDVSSLFKAPIALQILLAALGNTHDESKARVVSYETAQGVQHVPFSGGIVAISNLALSSKSNPVVQALRDRVHVINYDPSDEMMMALFRDLSSKGIRGLSGDECLEVCDYLVSVMDAESVRPTMRLFDKAIRDFELWKLKKCVSDWRDLIRSTLHEEAVVLEHPVNDLSRREQKDIECRIALEIAKTFETRAERVKAWEEQTGLSEKAFYRRLAEAKRMDLT